MAHTGATPRRAFPSPSPSPGPSPDGGGRRSRVREAWRRLTADPTEVDAAGLQAEVSRCGAAPISTCRQGQVVSLSGSLSTVTQRPRAGLPALEAEIWDGSGTITLVWLGRRRIAGIEPGRNLQVSGRLGGDAVTGPVMFNPAYTLRP